MKLYGVKSRVSAIQANLSFDSSLVPFLGRKRLIIFGANGLPSAKKGQIWSFLVQIMSSQVQKRAKFDISYLDKWPLERFNQIYLSMCDLCHPKEAQARSA